MINLIVACCKTSSNQLGIGKNGRIPWFLQKELNYFQKMTKKHIVVMGRKTYQSIGKCLPDRINIVISTTLDIKDIHIKENEELILVSNINTLDKIIYNYINTNRKVFIIGGEYLYNYYINKADNIILTDIDKTYECNSYFPDIPDFFQLTDFSSIMVEKNIKYRHLIYINKNTNSKTVDTEYLELLYKVLSHGNIRDDRTNTGTLSLFGEQLKIDISTYAPLLTTKKIAWKACIIELLWFLSGETDSSILESQNVHIWSGNTSRQFLDSRGLTNYKVGELGPGYGWQIRYSGAIYPDKTGGVDQLKYIENLLKTDPFSRRIMWNLWNPIDLDKMALVPCHLQLQLYVEKKSDNKMYLSGIVSMRSNDLFLGNPFNIFSYYVLIRILALKCDMEPNELILNIGDAHIYKNHIEQVKQQLSRRQKTQPKLELNYNIKYKDWNEILLKDFDVIGYFPHKSIKADMAI